MHKINEQYKYTHPHTHGMSVLTPEYSAEVTYEYVDLGLPSGTLWAKMNVGAKSETDYGLYFAWGETEGYTASQVGTDKQFTWADYKFGTSDNLTKYNSTDNKVVLDAEDDAAAFNMGGEWHMPTAEQYKELLKETKNGFVTNDGTFTQYAWNDNDRNDYSSPTQTTATISGWSTAGYFFFKNTYTSVTDAITANDYLFIPAAGSCDDGEVHDVGEWGYVWRSSLVTDDVRSAWSFYFGGSEAGGGNDDRLLGYSVRGVIGNIDK